MGRTLQQVTESLPAAQCATVEARAAVLIEEELPLQDLRKKRKFTQVDVARRLKKGQDAVSCIAGVPAVRSGDKRKLKRVGA